MMADLSLVLMDSHYIPVMTFENTPILQPTQKEQVCRMWNAEFPDTLSTTTSAFDSFLNSTKNHDHHLVLDIHGDIIAWALTFDRDGERWFSMIIDVWHQHQGIGSMLLQRMKEKEPRLNGWVIDQPGYTKENGDAYLPPVDFYIKNGFVLIPEVRFEDAKLSAVKIQWHG
jgi:hypothetical protein